MKTNKIAVLIPLMLCFFAMGFVDLVGIASNYVKEDLHLSDAEANIFPSLVFFWFLIFSVPTGMLMNKIGQKKTVLLSLIVTVASLVLGVLDDSYTVMLIAFSLLGIGNALMQTSLNPLLSNVVSGEKLAGSLTFGQFVKAIASFMAPIIAAWGATSTIPNFGLGWRILFPLYTILGALAVLLLSSTHIEEQQEKQKASTIIDCLALLKKPIVLLSFIGIMCHVGIDVGVNTTAPKILIERIAGMTLKDAGFATTLYFIFRTIGCLTGSYILNRFSKKAFFMLSVAMMAMSMVLFFVGHSTTLLYIAIALVGYGNSNIFPIILSQALLSVPQQKNEVSGLMIMGLFGGTVFPLVMGFASDAVGQLGAFVVLSVGVIYLFTYISKVKY